jgi:hypothetical protein
MRVWALAALLWLGMGATAWAETITPTTTLDPPGAGSCPTSCSLRQAIDDPRYDRIELEARTYQLTQSPELQIGRSLTILGIQADETFIEGRRLEIAGASVSLRNLAVTQGGIVLANGTLDALGVDSADSTATGLRVEAGTVFVDRSTVRGSGGPGNADAGRGGGRVRPRQGAAEDDHAARGEVLPDQAAARVSVPGEIG